MNKFVLIIFMMSMTTLVFGQPETATISTQAITQTGIGLGSVLAIVTSWDRNKSILWAIIHAIFGWFYVIYFALTRK